MNSDPSEAAVAILQLGIPVVLLGATWLTQHLISRSREKYLEERENHYRGVLTVTNTKQFPEGAVHDPVLVSGSAVIANNYFVSFAAAFKHIFGGEMKGYTRLCSDARRLALIRLYQEAEEVGANAVFNIRFETATITSSDSKKQGGGVELIAYGTAVRIGS